MKCPHCEKDIPGVTCSECGAVSPEEAKYCMQCGIALEREDDTIVEDNGFDVEGRVLCPDGTCTGIIVDGRCTECGKTMEEAEKSSQD